MKGGFGVVGIHRRLHPLQDRLGLTHLDIRIYLGFMHSGLLGSRVLTTGDVTTAALCRLLT